jgi:hypothetical protein
VAEAVMRGLRSLIVLVVIAAGLGAYIYFVESKRNPNGGKPAEKVFSVDAAAIDSLKVKSSSGDTTSLEKTGNDWKIVDPVKADADEGVVSGITSNLASLELQRVVEQKPGDYTQFGLQPPRLEIDFATKDDKTPHQLLVGSKTPTGGDMYARLAGQERVFLIQAYLDTTFDQKTFALRDKAVLKFSRSAVDTLAVTHAGRKVALAKTGGDWRLTSPWKARADYSTVEGLVGALDDGKMTAIVADPAEDLAKYGLDKPVATVEVGAGSTRATLEVGRPAEGATDRVYARDVSRPMVFEIEKSMADTLEKPVADYRARDLFDFRPFNATRVEFTRGGKTTVFEQVKTDKGQAWQETSPEKKTPDATAVNSVLSTFSNLRADSFVDSTRGTGLDSPAVSVKVTYGETSDRKTESVSFAKAGGAVYALHAGEPGAAKVDATAFGDALKALDALAK